MLKNALKQYIEGEKNLETPARILLAALVEFGKDSPNSVGTREISKRAKVNISAISYYFGSKAKLYEELLDQIIEFLRDMESGFRARYDALMKKASREGAKQLLKDYMFLSVCAADRGEGSDIFKHVESIMMREEFYGNKSFDKIYKSLVSPNDKFVSDMIEMASGGRISGGDAKIAAMIVTGQTVRFEISKRTLMRTMGWRRFDERESEKVCSVLGLIIDKIFA